MQTLCGRVAVVVAASDGVGAAIACCFGELGASVVVNYASDKAGAERVVAGRAVAFQSVPQSSGWMVSNTDISTQFHETSVLPVNRPGRQVS